MKRRLLSLVLLTVTMLALAGTAHADDPLDEQVRAIGRQIQCPVCQSVSVTDSSSDLAGQMRAIIRKKLEDGESPDAIVRYFTDRYGEGILLEPPKRGITLLIWMVPVAGLLAGAGVVYLLIRRRSGGGEEFDGLPDLDPELARYTEGTSRELKHGESEAG